LRREDRRGSAVTGIGPSWQTQSLEQLGIEKMPKKRSETNPVSPFFNHLIVNDQELPLTKAEVVAPNPIRKTVA
jgi:hypothetical protein